MSDPTENSAKGTESLADEKRQAKSRVLRFDQVCVV